MLRGSVLALSLAACVGRAPFLCQTSEQCVSQGQLGTCEANEFCSFPDVGCASGRRYASLAGELSGQCVSPLADGGSDGNPGPDTMSGVRPSNGVDPEALAGVTAVLEVVDGENWVIDTDSGAILRCGGPDVRGPGEGILSGIGLTHTASPPEGAPLAIFAVDSLRVAPTAQLYAVGGHALVLLARDRVIVDGLLELSGGERSCSVQTTCGLVPGDRFCGGPGGFVGGLGTDGEGPGGGAGPVSADTHGGGGGAFGGAGGAGGGGAGARPGGPVYGSMRLVPLVGGSGGGGSQGGGGGPRSGGGGGGALQITALGAIEVTSSGRVAVAGMGGSPGGTSGGGGGGGAGGAILLEAPTITIDGRLTANGGGGGGGGELSTEGTAGTFGPNPAPGGTGEFAGGGGGALISSNGGNGLPAGDAPESGGGGGGVGRIVLRYGVAADPSGDISPSPLLLQDLYLVP